MTKIGQRNFVEQCLTVSIKMESFTIGHIAILLGFLLLGRFRASKFQVNSPPIINAQSGKIEINIVNG